MLAPVAPNPVREEATIYLSLQEASDIALVVYDALGRRVSTLVSGHRTADSHVTTFGANSHAPRVYVVVLTHRGEIRHQSLVIIR